MSARSARFTDRESGKAAATSASSVTAMTAPRKRAVYGLRLEPRRLYSGKISSSATRARRRAGVDSTGLFFIFMPLAAGGRSRTDNTHFVRCALGEHNGQ